MAAARVLLVDDEPALLRLMQTYLTRVGYDVTAYPDGNSILQAEESASQSADLLIVDLTLPDISGDQVGIRMATAHAGLAVLVCSGYPFDVSVVPEALRGRFRALQKPFVPSMLAKAVEQLLGQRSS